MPDEKQLEEIAEVAEKLEEAKDKVTPKKPSATKKKTTKRKAKPKPKEEVRGEASNKVVADEAQDITKEEKDQVEDSFVMPKPEEVEVYEAPVPTEATETLSTTLDRPELPEITKGEAEAPREASVSDEEYKEIPAAELDPMDKPKPVEEIQKQILTEYAENSRAEEHTQEALEQTKRLEEEDEVAEVDSDYVKRLEADVASLRKQQLLGALTQAVPDQEEEEQEEPRHNRDTTDASNVVNAKSAKNNGMQIGGPWNRRRVKQKAQPKKVVSARRGVHQIFPDKPIHNVGEGTNTQDIPKRRGK